MKKFLYLFLALTGACTTDDGNAPPIESVDGVGEGTGMGMGDDDSEGEAGEASDDDEDGDATAADDGMADSTGAEDCADTEVGKYTCHGWVAALYCRTATDPTCVAMQFYSESPPQGQATIQAECVDDIQVCSPWMGTGDNPMTLLDCRQECEDRIAAGEYDGFPATLDASGLWTFQTVACVYADNGNNGVVPPDFYGGFAVNNQPSSAPKLACDNIAPVSDPPVPQTFYEGCYDDEDACFAETSCVGWSPTSNTTYSYNSSTRTHTATINRAWLQGLFANWQPMFECDPGSRFGTTSWKILSSASGDLINRLGARTNDYAFTFKKMPLGTTYNVTTFDSVANIIAVLASSSVGASFRITWKRPQTAAPYYAIHTLNITFS